MLQLKDFYFVRHGETDWNREHRGMGQKDIPLNKLGLEQAFAAAENLKNEPIRLICTSPLNRARTTAEIIAKKLMKPLVEIPELSECCWGENEGKIKGPWTDDWIAGTAVIPGAEPYDRFLLRAATGVNLALDLEKEGSVLVVAHGGVFWAVQKFAQLGSRFDLGNARPVLLRAPSQHDIPWAYSYLELVEE